MKKYKKFLITLTVSTLLLAIIYYLVSFRNEEPTEELVWIRNCLVKKHQYADIEENKVIVTSGSSTLFGVRTKEMSEKLNIPIYNLAVHAGLGLDFILNDAKKSLKNGDIVILPLEYTHFAAEGEMTKLAYDYNKVFGEEKFSTIITVDSIKSVFQEKPYDNVKFLIKGMINEKSAFVENPNGYNSENLNDHGDQTMNIGVWESDLARVEPFEIPEEYKETVGLRMLKDFNEWCIEKNITLFVTYPNTLYFEVYDSSKYQKYFSFLDEYFSRNKISTIGQPSDFFYDKVYFYDTGYHLNEDGMTVRTQELISFIENLPEIKTIQSKNDVNKVNK